ncbi:MAG: glycosyl hydrolase family 18 protein [Minisyncoccia bacterium]
MKVSRPGFFVLAFAAAVFLCAGGTSLAASFTRSLYVGRSGSDVVMLQNDLISLGDLASGKNTGYFGSLTQTAVEKFQCAQKIACSAKTQGYGVFGPATRAALLSAISGSNSTGSSDSGAASAPSSPASGTISRSLSLGMQGSDVTLLQQTLIAKGYLAAGLDTGYFGSLTRRAVEKFQCAQGIVCSGAAYGLVGPHTRAALGLSQSSLEVVGWLPYWSETKGIPDAIAHMKELSAIMPFGFEVNSDGTLYDAFGLGTETGPAELLASARANGVKVIPTFLWSNTSAISNVLSNTDSRVALEDTIAITASQEKFDGVDINFENKTAEAENYFSTFLEGLKERLGGKLLYCTIEARTPIDELYAGTPPPGAGDYANDYAAINQYCDRVQLMTYDQETADVMLNQEQNGAPYVPIADPKWVESVVNLASQTIAKNKIMIGVATYGYEWTVTPLSVAGYRYDLQWAFDPDYAPQIESQFNVVPVRNAAGELSIAYLPNSSTGALPGVEPANTASNNPTPATTTYSDGVSTPSASPSFNLLWWSDARAVSDKVKLAQTLGVDGVAIFKIDGGEDPNIWNILPTPRK